MCAGRSSSEPAGAGKPVASRRKLNRVRRTESCVAEGNDRGEA